MSKDTVFPDPADTLTVCTSVDELKKAIRNIRAGNQTIGFVPTMGALHEGHFSLIDIAKQKTDAVIVSIFVNPAQFGPNEDFDSYPRQLQEDVDACKKAGVDIVFAPDRDEMYDDSTYLSIKIDTLNDYMCGASRPGFFEGILLIVNKLFNLIEPDVAVFGQKDIQQIQIIRQMVKEFNHGVEIVAAPIQRANDGLALSSRNTYLTRDQRTVAPGLFRSLQYIEQQIISGVNEPKLLIEHQKDELEAKGFEIDYLNVFTEKTLSPVTTLSKDERYILAGAAYLGKTRLIDNILIEL
ncbi:pantoate--beta-alanine ligase [Rhodohalobacter sp. 8-1]|uniref:pantoate--beta-alanine ligase n=1 Tax=Rhodohalobacter sp. 8-1 TaxID=3131972 RepID=UPI0030ED8313